MNNIFRRMLFFVIFFVITNCGNNSASNTQNEDQSETEPDSLDDAKSRALKSNKKINIKVDSSALINYCNSIESKYNTFDVEQRKELFKVAELKEELGYISGGYNKQSNGDFSSHFINIELQLASENVVIVKWSGLEEGQDFGFEATEVFELEGVEWKALPDALEETTKSHFYVNDELPDWPHDIAITIFKGEPRIKAELIAGASDPYLELYYYIDKYQIDLGNLKYEKQGSLEDPELLKLRKQVQNSEYSELELAWDEGERKFKVTSRKQRER